ncbi:hypothetical protein OBBRIDRAFT_814387 [Obba rivulosa]|uniref:Uncharacterized protein n=1 Tax=Obba rivulosa TaxID=1052685 RepID=A0A8E2ALM0_9APHY|nr:hypothetical protein OBBRIDRAFT_814387 [Obba rivulosa]
MQSYLAYFSSLSAHYWDGKPHWTPQTQRAYASDDKRPEFIPFKVVRLLPLYDNSGFWEYPVRMGWKVHRRDHRCHSGRCPPGMCVAAGSEQRTPYGLQTPSISRMYGRVATVSEKVAFLQAWLFFGALTEFTGFF